MTKTQRMKEIKNEIEWYEIKKKIADAMLRLGELGFEISGHGCGCGGEDFNLVRYKDGAYVNFCDQGRKIVVNVTLGVEDDEPEDVLTGTIGQAMKYVEGI